MADNNTFQVSGANNISFNGNPVSGNPNFLESWTNYGINRTPKVDTSATVTLDGSALDIFYYNNLAGVGFLFSDQDVYTAAFSYFFNENQPYFRRTSRWNASIAADVPEPATWAMMLLGFGAIGFAMRRRSAGIEQVA